MRLAVYCDLRYQRRTDALYCEESFARFAAGLRDWADGLVLVGRGADVPEPAFGHRLRGDVELLALPGYSSLARPGALARSLRASLVPLWRMLGGVDGVWVLGPHPVGVACVALAAARRRRVVLGVREDLREYVRRRHPRASGRAVAWALDVVWRALARVIPVVVVGDELAARYGSGRRVLPIAVSLVGADELIDAARALGRDYDGERRVLVVGRLDPEKNPLLLADVLARLRRRDPAWRVVVCGAGTLSGELTHRLEALGVAGQAELRGVVGSDELRALYESSHAMLHVAWTEGVPQVLFEAWAAGLPVVATDVGGVAGIAEDAALLIPPGNAEAAALALERLAGDATLRRAMIEAGFERVRRYAPAAECRRVAALLEATSRHPPPAHRHMWFWTVLGPDDRRVAVVGDPELGALLAASGFQLVDRSAGAPDAVLIGARGGAGRRAARSAAAGLREGGVVAIALGGGPAAVPADQSRPGRALELLAGPVDGLVAGGRGVLLGRMLRRRRLAVATLATGARARPYGIGPGVLRHGRRVPVGVVVSASRSPARPSVAELAVEEAAEALGAPLRRVRTTVVESGKVLTELVDPAGRRYILRLAGGPARPPLEHALWCLKELAAADPPRLVRDRIAWPIADGEVGLARYVLEWKAPGAHPRRIPRQLWRECVDFLIGLHSLRRPPQGERDGGVAAVADRADAVSSHVDGPQRTALERIVGRLRADLAAAPIGWAHGDFWNENLLTRGGRFERVVDWDWAAPHSLPMFDLFDLTALGQRRTRDLRHGPRLLLVLWPLARAGGDERLRRYSDATETPADVRTLEALTVAYWLDRLARDLRPFHDHPRRPGWLAENVDAPLAALERAGW